MRHTINKLIDFGRPKDDKFIILGFQTFAIWLLFPITNPTFNHSSQHERCEVTCRALMASRWSESAGRTRPKSRVRSLSGIAQRRPSSSGRRRARFDLCVKAVFDRDWNTSENLRDTIAQRGAASNRWITSEKQLECRCVDNKRPIEHRKTNTLQHASTRCKSVGRESNNSRKRAQRSHVSGNGGAEQAASEVVSNGRPATVVVSQHSKKKFRRLRRTPRYWLTELQEFQIHDPKNRR